MMIAFPRALAALEAGVRRRPARRGATVPSATAHRAADVAVGHARPGVPMTADTIMLWLSATKPAAAVCIAQLWGARGN